MLLELPAFYPLAWCSLVFYRIGYSSIKSLSSEAWMLTTWWTDWDQDCLFRSFVVPAHPSSTIWRHHFQESQKLLAQNIRNWWRDDSRRESLKMFRRVFMYFFPYWQNWELLCCAVGGTVGSKGQRISVVAVLHLPDSLLLPTVKHTVRPASQTSTPAFAARLFVT